MIFIYSFYYHLFLSQIPFLLTSFIFFSFCFFIQLLAKKLFFFFWCFIVFFCYFFFLNFECFFLGINSLKKFDLLSFSFFLFILREFMVFFSLFWSHFHSFYTSRLRFCFLWPPKGLEPANPRGLIIFGTRILLRSRFVIILSHLKFLFKLDYFMVSIFFFMNVFMGMLFLDIQFVELTNIMFQISFNFIDSFFRNVFVCTISLHSSHVFIGVIFLIISFIVLNLNFFSLFFCIGFEMRIWYWHFVDYIWIAVFSVFYYFNI